MTHRRSRRDLSAWHGRKRAVREVRVACWLASLASKPSSRASSSFAACSIIISCKALEEEQYLARTGLGEDAIEAVVVLSRAKLPLLVGLVVGTDFGLAKVEKPSVVSADEYVVLLNVTVIDSGLVVQ